MGRRNWNHFIPVSSVTLQQRVMTCTLFYAHYHQLELCLSKLVQTNYSILFQRIKITLHRYIFLCFYPQIFFTSNGRIKSGLMQYKHSQLLSTCGPFFNNKIVWRSNAWRKIELVKTLMKWQTLILSYWKHKAFCFRIVQGKMLHTNTQHTTG